MQLPTPQLDRAPQKASVTIHAVCVCCPILAALLSATPAQVQSLDDEIKSLENGLCTTRSEGGGNFCGNRIRRLRPDRDGRPT
jgi:hypothetical protein